MSDSLTDLQRMKFGLLADGARISSRASAVLAELVDGALTPADYASTTGLIVQLAEAEWVNMPVVTHNPNFVDDSTEFTFDHGVDGFVVRTAGLEVPAAYWPPPRYHGKPGADGRPLNNYVFTHADRARLSPTIGCSMVCTFCNIPYDDRYGGVKSIEGMLAAVRTALADPVQPAHHLLISGGSPGPAHVPRLREVYEQVLIAFPEVAIDIMMVPVLGLFDLPRLAALGVGELSINLEIFNETISAEVMRHKHRQGRRHYLDFIATAAAELGVGRVRSMLMVGLEPNEDTIEGVRAIAARGGVPVLSPFRPDPATPMANLRPPTADELATAYLTGTEAAAKFGVSLGPNCGPCTHNTMTFVKDTGDAHTHGNPRMLNGL